MWLFVRNPQRFLGGEGSFCDDSLQFDLVTNVLFEVDTFPLDLAGSAIIEDFVKFVSDRYLQAERFCSAKSLYDNFAFAVCVLYERSHHVPPFLFVCAEYCGCAAQNVAFLDVVDIFVRFFHLLFIFIVPYIKPFVKAFMSFLREAVFKR